MEECYPDTIEGDSSNLSAITAMRLNSMEENYLNTVGVVGSNPTVATNWPVAQLEDVPGF
jgi:hypothetical protein